MRGKHRVIVQNNRLHYEFEIKRNITIIRGDSATGKTTLINMLRQAENLGNSSGIEVSCDVPCRILEGSNWKLILEHTENSIFFIDEENVFVHTVEFASCVKDSGNYFVLITRENLYGLPYSVEKRIDKNPGIGASLQIQQGAISSYSWTDGRRNYEMVCEGTGLWRG